MICFFTSATGPYQTPALYTENHFVDRLKAALPGPVRGLWVANDPATRETTVPFALEVRDAFVNAGFPVEAYTILDDLNAKDAARLVAGANLIILSGGEIPVQSWFFERIGLKGLLHGWDGVLVGISAGSMNSADTVLVPPEAPGDPLDPACWPEYSGLGLTRYHIVPHFQYLRSQPTPNGGTVEALLLEGSRRWPLLALNDGSYIFKDAAGNETVCGEAYRIADGEIVQISKNEA